jgi:hypothetical protein
MPAHASDHGSAALDSISGIGAVHCSYYMPRGICFTAMKIVFGWGFLNGVSVSTPIILCMMEQAWSCVCLTDHSGPRVQEWKAMHITMAPGGYCLAKQLKKLHETRCLITTAWRGWVTKAIFPEQDHPFCQWRGIHRTNVGMEGRPSWGWTTHRPDRAGTLWGSSGLTTCGL